VKSGQTIVVGGLIKDKDEKTMKKMPFFGDIPILGAMFRHRDQTKDERELIVFITPHIIGYQEAVNLAKSDTVIPPLSVSREQSVAVSRKEEVDNLLERWEN
jgi:type II secretory pathway component GspD/PulD (secretin)